MSTTLSVRCRENELYRELTTLATRLTPAAIHHPGLVTDYIGLVREQTWQQEWNPETRTMQQLHSVTGQLWSAAIEQCLAENGTAFIPQMSHPIYLERPLVLHRGNRLIVHPETELRLAASSAGLCMVCNAAVTQSPVTTTSLSANADDRITIEGGIWSDRSRPEQVRGGAYDTAGSLSGSHGVFLLADLTELCIRNVTFRDCSGNAVQVGKIRNFLIEHITLDETADGIHVNGNSAHGIIRHIKGKTNDDVVALNAWDWTDGGIAFGDITDILVEDIESVPGYVWSEIRLLPGVKSFKQLKQKIACDIRRCIFRNIRGIHTFKMYDQPNLSNPEEDCSDPIGRMSDLFFSNLIIAGIRQTDYYDKSSDGVFDVCADVDGMTVRDVRLDYTPGANGMAPYLVSAGPKALTWPRGPKPEDGWKEVFNPEANPVVAGLTVKQIFQTDPANPNCYIPVDQPAGLINTRRLTLNPDFPHSMPRGGTGQGKIVDPIVLE